MGLKIIIIIFTFILDIFMKSHKDKVIIGMSVIVGLGLIGYVVYLFVNNLQISSAYNMLSLAIIALVGLLILIMGIPVIKIPRLRVIQTLLGLGLIFFANYMLQDDPSKNIFMKDILNVIGAFLTIAGPVGIMVLDSVKKQIEEAKIEIIEV